MIVFTFKKMMHKININKMIIKISMSSSKKKMNKKNIKMNKIKIYKSKYSI